jgi:hypothetical protein
VIDPFAGTETPVSTPTDLDLPPQTTLIIRVAARATDETRTAGARGVTALLPGMP